MNDYKNYMELKNRIVRTNKEVSELYIRLVDNRLLSIAPVKYVVGEVKVKTNKTNDKNLGILISAEELEAEMIAKEQLIIEMEKHLLKIEEQAIEPIKFKVFKLRWFGINKDGKRYSHDDISKVVPYSKTEVGRIIEKIEKELNN